MKSLPELRSLVALARKFGQEPSAELLEHIDILEKEEAQRLKRESEIRSRIAGDLTELFNLKEKVNELVQSPPAQEHQEESVGSSDPVVDTITEQAEPKLSEAKPIEESIVDKVAKVIKESGVVAPDPELAKPQKNLELEIKYLREWVGKIAALGPGSGEVNFRWLDDVDRSSINKDWFLNYEPSTKKFTFVDTRCSIEAFDRSSSITLNTTPTLLRPGSVINNKNITYDSSTGVFTFLRECEVTLALTINAVSSAANERVYQYAERNTGSGWTVIANSGKNIELINGQHTQIVNAQTISREPGEQIRYFIYSNTPNKVNLITETLPNTTGVTVYIPAIRIQFAGR